MRRKAKTPYNPSVTASPCQLPLHKGAFRPGKPEGLYQSMAPSDKGSLFDSMRAALGAALFYGVSLSSGGSVGASVGGAVGASVGGVVGAVVGSVGSSLETK